MMISRPTWWRRAGRASCWLLTTAAGREAGVMWPAAAHPQWQRFRGWWHADPVTDGTLNRGCLLIGHTHYSRNTERLCFRFRLDSKHLRQVPVKHDTLFKSCILRLLKVIYLYLHYKGSLSNLKGVTKLDILLLLPFFVFHNIILFYLIWIDFLLQRARFVLLSFLHKKPDIVIMDCIPAHYQSWGHYCVIRWTNTQYQLYIAILCSIDVCNQLFSDI